MGTRPMLTELQLKLLEVLWDRGEATVREVQAALAPDRARARSTVATLLSRLEEKGVVTHREVGREYLYRATIGREAVRGALLSGFAEEVFHGDVPALVQQLLRLEEVEPEDLARVREMIEAAEARGEGARDG